MCHCKHFSFISAAAAFTGSNRAEEIIEPWAWWKIGFSFCCVSRRVKNCSEIGFYHETSRNLGVRECRSEIGLKDSKRGKFINHGNQIELLQERIFHQLLETSKHILELDQTMKLTTFHLLAWSNPEPLPPALNQFRWDFDFFINIFFYFS